MALDWHAWHHEYDDPASSLSQRLTVVRAELCRALEWLDAAGTVEPRLLSLCAGDGRDTLPVLASGHTNVRATLVELDPVLAGRAAEEVTRRELSRVEVRVADAGHTDSLAGAGPADVLMACGVFGNVTDEDMVSTVQLLPTLLAPDGVVLWTRGNKVPLDPATSAGDPSEAVRATFLASGFEEVAFVRSGEHGFRVGVHRLVGDPLPFQPGRRMFAFS